MRERPGELTPVAVESIERVARRLLIELLQARAAGAVAAEQNLRASQRNVGKGADAKYLV